jgi:hypothetical protein
MYQLVVLALAHWFNRNVLLAADFLVKLVGFLLQDYP